jgi:hypothetical protein
MIIRDNNGTVKITSWWYLPGCESAEQAEVIACLEGLKNVIDQHFWPATIETDYSHVLQAVASDSLIDHPTGAFTEKSRSSLDFIWTLLFLKLTVSAIK